MLDLIGSSRFRSGSAKCLLTSPVPPGAADAATVADSAGLRLPTLPDQSEGGKEKGPNLLVTGLTGLSLAAATEFGSASTGADLLPWPEGITADGAPAVTGIRGSAFHMECSPIGLRTVGT
jgi:hypothetical protein